MSTIHMETDATRAMASQLKQASESTRGLGESVNSSVQSIDWIGASRDEFVAEAQAISRAIDAQAEAGAVLASRVGRETAEWEQAAAGLGGPGGETPISGGGAGNWPQLPSSPLAPIFTIITIAPWL